MAPALLFFLLIQVLLDSLDADVGLNTIGASGTGSALSSLLQTDVFDYSLAAAANLTVVLDLASANQLYVGPHLPFPSPRLITLIRFASWEKRKKEEERK